MSSNINNNNRNISNVAPNNAQVLKTAATSLSSGFGAIQAAIAKRKNDLANVHNDTSLAIKTLNGPSNSKNSDYNLDFLAESDEEEEDVKIEIKPKSSLKPQSQIAPQVPQAPPIQQVHQYQTVDQFEQSHYQDNNHGHYSGYNNNYGRGGFHKRGRGGRGNRNWSDNDSRYYQNQNQSRGQPITVVQPLPVQPQQLQPAEKAVPAPIVPKPIRIKLVVLDPIPEIEEELKKSPFMIYDPIPVEDPKRAGKIYAKITKLADGRKVFVTDLMIDANELFCEEQYKIRTVSEFLIIRKEKKEGGSKAQGNKVTVKELSIEIVGLKSQIENLTTKVDIQNDNIGALMSAVDMLIGVISKLNGVEVPAASPGDGS